MLLEMICHCLLLQGHVKFASHYRVWGGHTVGQMRYGKYSSLFEGGLHWVLRESNWAILCW